MRVDLRGGKIRVYNAKSPCYLVAHKSGQRGCSALKTERGKV